MPFSESMTGTEVSLEPSDLSTPQPHAQAPHSDKPLILLEPCRLFGGKILWRTRSKTAGCRGSVQVGGLPGRSEESIPRHGRGFAVRLQLLPRSFWMHRRRRTDHYRRQNLRGTSFTNMTAGWPQRPHRPSDRRTPETRVVFSVSKARQSRSALITNLRMKVLGFYS